MHRERKTHWQRDVLSAREKGGGDRSLGRNWRHRGLHLLFALHDWSVRSGRSVGPALWSVGWRLLRWIINVALACRSRSNRNRGSRYAPPRIYPNSKDPAGACCCCEHCPVCVCVALEKHQLTKKTRHRAGKTVIVRKLKTGRKHTYTHTSTPPLAGSGQSSGGKRKRKQKERARQYGSIFHFFRPLFVLSLFLSLPLALSSCLARCPPLEWHVFPPISLLRPGNKSRSQVNLEPAKAKQKSECEYNVHQTKNRSTVICPLCRWHWGVTLLFHGPVNDRTTHTHDTHGASSSSSLRSFDAARRSLSMVYLLSYMCSISISAGLCRVIVYLSIF